MIEPGSCVSMAKPLELFCGIEHQALKKSHDYFIPAGMLTKAGFKEDATSSEPEGGGNIGMTYEF